MPALDPTHLAAASVLAVGWGTHATTLSHRLSRARRDPLTALHTRDTFTRHATRILHHGPALVVLIDLDHFKPLNDRFGHAAGDAVLAATAARLATWAGRGGAAGRLGGDEFAATRTTTDPPHDLTALHHALTRPLDYGGAILTVGASIGAFHAPPATPLPHALNLADRAMYTAKTHRSGWHQAHPDTPLIGAAHRWKRTRPAQDHRHG
jgi:diguanylate cyclase (GGDEF)-like protein